MIPTLTVGNLALQILAWKLSLSGRSEGFWEIRRKSRSRTKHKVKHLSLRYCLVGTLHPKHGSGHKALPVFAKTCKKTVTTGAVVSQSPS